MIGGVVSNVFSITVAFVLAAAFALAAGVVPYFLVPETHVSEHQTSIRPWEIDTTLPTLTVGLVNFGLFFAYLGALTLFWGLRAETNGIGILSSHCSDN